MAISEQAPPQTALTLVTEYQVAAAQIRRQLDRLKGRVTDPLTEATADASDYGDQGLQVHISGHIEPSSHDANSAVTAISPNALTFIDARQQPPYFGIAELTADNIFVAHDVHPVPDLAKERTWPQVDLIIPEADTGRRLANPLSNYIRIGLVEDTAPDEPRHAFVNLAFMRPHLATQVGVAVYENGDLEPAALSHIESEQTGVKLAFTFHAPEANSVVMHAQCNPYDAYDDLTAQSRRIRNSL